MWINDETSIPDVLLEWIFSLQIYACFHILTRYDTDDPPLGGFLGEVKHGLPSKMWSLSQARLVLENKAFF